MLPYLDSLREYADFPVNFIGVGFEPPYLQGATHSIFLDGAQNAGAPNETQCIQHGSFLNVIDAPDSETLIYTDGDMVMQRKLDDEERAFLMLENNQAVVGLNFGWQSTLINDAKLLGQQISDAELIERYGEYVVTHQDYNVGFLAMTRQTWELVYGAYMEDYPAICGVFTHMARQQWLISWELAKLGLAVKLCPWSIHAHGHGGLKPGMHYGNGGLWADGKLAAWRHHA
jgi:hypothetical protein